MNKTYKTLRKFGVAILGFLVIILGILLVPLPGPGLLVIILGLAILSWEFEWAERRMNQLKTKTERVIKNFRHDNKNT